MKQKVHTVLPFLLVIAVAFTFTYSRNRNRSQFEIPEATDTAMMYYLTVDKINISFKNVTFDQIADSLKAAYAHRGTINFSNANNFRNGRISITLQQKTLPEILDSILHPDKMRWVIHSSGMIDIIP